MRSTGNAWLAEEWGSDHQFTAEIQGVAGATIRIGLEKQAYLNELPYIISRIGLYPGARERCYELLALIPLHEHNRVTLEYFAPDSDLKRRIDAMESWDDLSDQVLLIRQRKFWSICLCDSHNEGPHAWFSSETSHSSRATFAWKSVSARLVQNLADHEDLTPCLDTFAPQNEFDDFKKVLQTSGRRRSVRCSRPHFESDLYTVKAAFAPRRVEVLDEFIVYL